MPNNIKLSISDTKVLDVCCKIEEVGADIYRHFSRLFADNPKARELWIKTSIEEDNHAEQFRLASRLQGQGMHSLKTDLDKVNDILTKIQSLYESIVKSSPSYQEALRLAIKLEYSMINCHVYDISNFNDENIAHLFLAMMQNDKDHIMMLEKALDELS